MSASYESFVVALAAPIVRAQGGEEHVFGGNIPEARARALLEALLQVTNGKDARALLETFAQHGQRAEWKQYQHHAGGAWVPEPQDHSVVRKAAYALEHRSKLGDRGLLAFDGMRSSAIAGLAFAGGLLSRQAALAAVGASLVTAVAKEHASWDEVAEHVRLAFGFTDGETPAEIEEAMSTLLAKGGLWQAAAWPGAAKLVAPKVAAPKGNDEDLEREGPTTRAPVIVAVELSVDCPGCGMVVSLEALHDRATCAACGELVVIEQSEWKSHIARSLPSLRRGTSDADPITNDFGSHFFSRSRVRAVDRMYCTCGAPVDIGATAGTITCAACQRAIVVHSADESARAILPRARLVVVPPRAPVAPPASFSCAACDASIPLGRARIERCPSCKARSYVDDATWRAAHGPEVRPTTYVVCAF